MLSQRWFRLERNAGMDQMNCSRTLKVSILVISLLMSAGCSDGDSMTTSNDRPSNANPLSVDSGYVSTEQDWHSFLSCWRSHVQARLARGESYTKLQSVPPALNQLSVDSTAAKRAIADAERRLGIKLPASYVHFVLASGDAGWFIESFGTPDDANGKLISVSAIDLYPRADPENFGYWSNSGPDTLNIEAEKYLPMAITASHYYGRTVFTSESISSTA